MWKQIAIQTRSADCAELESLLLDQGALSITLLDDKDQPIFQKEPGATPLWDSVKLVALFAEEQDLDSLVALLRFQPAVLNRDQITVEDVADQDWERSWMDSFQAMQYGENLWICPSWQEPPDPAAVNIMLDPGLAFGSGTHATTALCLRWLAATPMAGKEVVDYGCGSGVLGIAAALLGARTVHAVDNDAQAIAATVDNSHRNNIASGQLTAYLPDALPAVKADILLANILAEPLHELADHLAELVKPGGSLVLSGILLDQAEALIASYSRWFDMDREVTEGDWVRLSGTRRD
jgi:ribosomal protein L11 methyltransferase